MVTKRDPDRTRRKVLGAARDEFSAVGPAGARIDRIAAAAGVNKRMIYHYFGSKDGLFDAVLDDAAQDLELTGHEPAARLASLAEREDLLRLWMWQALAHGEIDGREVVNRVFAGTEIEAGSHAALALLAVAVFPAVLAPLGAQITGLDPGSDEFARGQRRVLRRLVGALGDKPRLRYRW